MMSVADRTFLQLKQDGEIVDLFRETLDKESLTGIITDFSDDFVYMSLYSEEGRANGIAIVFRDDITRVRWAGNERKSIAELVATSGAKPMQPAIRLDSIESVLRDVSEAFGYVNVLTERANSDITFIGEIVELDRDTLVLETYGTFSSRDRGKLMVTCREITRVDADAAYERSVRYLAQKDFQGERSSTVGDDVGSA